MFDDSDSEDDLEDLNGGSYCLGRGIAKLCI